MPDFTVIVVTHNRANVLAETLASLARVAYAGKWEVLVVDNNSSDDTKGIVSGLQKRFPVELRYLFEGTPGKYRALNAGIGTSRSTFIAATDDDAYPSRDWLQRAEAGLARFGCDFVGGPVFPLWRATPPRWVDARDAITGKVLGLQDHGGASREYGQNGVSWPLGVNVAYRRTVFDRVGLFDPRLGRVAGTLRNQSQRDWHLRARAAGARGMYLPRMTVHHSVDAERLTRRYFHRWFYWHGISRAIMYEMRGVHLLEPEGDTTHDGERHFLGVPMSLWRRGALAAGGASKRWALARSDDAVQYELMVCFCAGVIRQRLKDRATAAARARAVEPSAGQAGRRADDPPVDALPTVPR